MAGGSHFNWLDGDRLMVTAKFEDAIYSHVLFTVGKSDYVRLGGGVLDFDGHGVFSNDGKWMATDTYPDKLGGAQADGAPHVGPGHSAAGHVLCAGDIPGNLFALAICTRAGGPMARCWDSIRCTSFRGRST